jgi:methionine salvage enolase-phosphatase E1
LLDKIYEIQKFDRDAVLLEINRQLAIQESQNVLISDTFAFIQKYHEEYDFFTNTSLPKSSLIHIVETLDIKKYFLELLAYDDGSKRENILYILEIYGVSPQNILFIDDKQSHIDAVKNT